MYGVSLYNLYKFTINEKNDESDTVYICIFHTGV